MKNRVNSCKETPLDELKPLPKRGTSRQRSEKKAQSERDSHSKNRGGEKTILTIRYLYHENTS